MAARLIRKPKQKTLRKRRRKLWDNDEHEESDPMFDDDSIAIGAGEKAKDGEG